MLSSIKNINRQLFIRAESVLLVNKYIFTMILKIITADRFVIHLAISKQYVAIESILNERSGVNN